MWIYQPTPKLIKERDQLQYMIQTLQNSQDIYTLSYKPTKVLFAQLLHYTNCSDFDKNYETCKHQGNRVMFCQIQKCLHFFTHGILMDAETTKDFTHTLSEIIHEFNKIVDYKISIKYQLYYYILAINKFHLCSCILTNKKFKKKLSKRSVGFVH